MSREVHARPLALACAAGHSPAREIVQFGLTEQQPDGAQIFGPTIDQGCLGPSHCLRAISRGVKTDIRLWS